MGTEDPEEVRLRCNAHKGDKHIANPPPPTPPKNHASKNPTGNLTRGIPLPHHDDFGACRDGEESDGTERGDVEQWDGQELGPVAALFAGPDRLAPGTGHMTSDESSGVGCTS